MKFRRLGIAAWGKGQDGSMYPILSTFSTDDPSLPYALTLELGLIAGKPVIKALRAEQRPGGPPVTRRGLNSLPIGKITEELATQNALQIEGPRHAAKARSSTREEQDRIRKALRPARGRRGDAASHRALIEQVASLYQELIDNQIRHPKPVIATKLGYSSSYIGALVAEARQAGLLGSPSGPGRAGSETPSKPSRRKRNNG